MVYCKGKDNNGKLQWHVVTYETVVFEKLVVRLDILWVVNG